MRDAITVRLALPENFRASARHILREFSLRWGVPVQIVNDPQAEVDLVYGEPGGNDRGAFILPCDPESYSQAAVYQGVDCEGRRLWASSEAPDSRHDPIGAVLRLLMLWDEHHIPSRLRDRNANFLLENLGDRRAAQRLTAMVEEEAEWLLDRLIQHNRRRLQRMERWPEGKKFAAILTHDVDAVRLGAPMEILFNAAKMVVRLDLMRGRMAAAGLFNLFYPAERDVLFRFHHWADWEAKRGVKSCFYCFIQPTQVSCHLNDCRTSLDNSLKDWSLLRAMADDGWEFGLHPSIKAKTSAAEFIAGKRVMEERLGRAIIGVRHHYLALDWLNPFETFARHLDAGFEYDSSFAYRDGAGFRAGTSLPFRPFDSIKGEALNYWEIPLTVMDGHITEYRMGDTPAERRRSGWNDAVKTLEETCRVGGVLVLNWHQEGISDRFTYKGTFSLLEEYLAHPLFKDVWWTTPAGLIQYWEAREKRLIFEDDKG